MASIDEENRLGNALVALDRYCYWRQQYSYKHGRYSAIADYENSLSCTNCYVRGGDKLESWDYEGRIIFTRYLMTRLAPILNDQDGLESVEQ